MSAMSSMHSPDPANLMGTGSLPFASLKPEEQARLSDVLVALLKGVIYRDEDRHGRWKTVLLRQSVISWYVEFLGLELMVDEAEGYAYLRNRARDDEDMKEGDLPVPRLMPRHQLSYLASLLLALLRKELNEFDAREGETKLVLSVEQMLDRIRTFLPETTNEAGLRNHVTRAIDRIERLGFLRSMKNQENAYEVRRIIKAYVDAQWLADFDERLDEYRDFLKENGESLFRRGPRNRLVRMEEMETDMEAGMDADMDAEADVDADADMDGETDVDADAGMDGGTDVDADAGMDGHGGAGRIKVGGTGVPGTGLVVGLDDETVLAGSRLSGGLSEDDLSEGELSGEDNLAEDDPGKAKGLRRGGRG